MKTKINILLVIWALASLTSCKGQPEIINHPPPNLTAPSMDVFSNELLPVDFGCTEIQAPSSLVGGLTPSYPIAVCSIQYPSGEGTEELTTEIESGQYFYYTGGLFGTFVRYIVYQNGEFVLLKTEDEFRKVFAPIESPQEALSYVVAVKNLSASYGIQYFPDLVYEVDTIEDTYVLPDADGYLVHLFYDQVFGCGPHWTSEVDVHVSLDGSIEERGGRALFRDPNLDELCVD
jgi:hypothetical protein